MSNFAGAYVLEFTKLIMEYIAAAFYLDFLICNSTSNLNMGLFLNNCAPLQSLLFAAGLRPTPAQATVVSWVRYCNYFRFPNLHFY